MKISFIVTFYNQEKYVDDSLESISKINLPSDYEVLVGDDGSSDSTLETVLKWKECFGNHLKIFRGDRHDGVTDYVERASNMRKRILYESDGDCFCILDGDDLYDDGGFISDAIDVFKKNKGISVVMSNYSLLIDGQRIIRENKMQKGIVDSKYYLVNYYSHAGACVFRNIKTKEFFEGIDKSIYYDDNDITINQLKYGDIYYTGKSIYLYRQSPDSIWNSASNAEKGIINVLGADVEAKLVPEYEKEIYFRYRKDILYAYFRKERYLSYIGEKHRQVIRDWKDKTSLMYNVCFCSSLASEEMIDKAEMIIGYIRREDPKEYDRIYTNCETEI